MDHGSSPRYVRDRSRRSAGAGSPVVGAVVVACIAGLLGVLILAGAVATSARDGGGTTLSPAADAPAGPSPSSPSTPTWRLASYRRAGFDKSFKADLIDELPTPPELVVFGGSRATRFEPSYLASTHRPVQPSMRRAVLPSRGRLGVQQLPVLPRTRHSPALHHRPADAHVPRRHPACGPAVRPAPGERVPAGSGRPPEGGAREATRQGTAGREPLSRPGLSGPQPLRRRARASRLLVRRSTSTCTPGACCPSTAGTDRWPTRAPGPTSRRRSGSTTTTTSCP